MAHSRIDTVWITVSDMKASAAFYGSLLQKEPEISSDNWTSFDLGCVNLALHAGGGDAAVGGWVPSLVVEDILAARTRVVEAGGKVSDGFHDTPRGAVMDVTDLDGGKLQVMQLGTKAADLKAQI
jgi:predicted enzyme related to lactoylglutathione lyase